MAQLALGNLSKAGYVATPLKSVVMRRVGQSQVRELASGAVAVQRSPRTHIEYDFEFFGTESRLRSLMETLQSYTAVVNGRETDPLYVLMPDMQNRNLLPDHWAMPGLSYSLAGMYAKTVPLPPRTIGGIPTLNPSATPSSLRLWATPYFNASVVSAGSSAGTTPQANVLIPPGYVGRLSAWGTRNNATFSPVVGYTVEDLPRVFGVPGGSSSFVLSPTGTPGTAPATATIAAVSNKWRLLSVYLRTATAANPTYLDTHWTDFIGLDFRMGAGLLPSAVTVLEPGVGLMPMTLRGNEINSTLLTSKPNRQSLYRISLPMTEVDQPW